MFCMKCGTKLPDDALFCYKCGYKITVPVDENVSKAEANTEVLGSDNKPAKDCPVCHGNGYIKKEFDTVLGKMIKNVPCPKCIDTDGTKISDDANIMALLKIQNDNVSNVNKDDKSAAFDKYFGNQNQDQNNVNELPNELDILIELELTSGELISGASKEIIFDCNDKCDHCQGSGKEPDKTCSRCNGEGQIRVAKRTRLKTTYSTETCPKCQGKGIITSTSTPCQKCHGKGTLKIQKSLTIIVPAGMKDGSRLHLKEQGNIDLMGTQRGDVYVQLKLKESLSQESNTLQNVPVVNDEDIIKSGANYFVDRKNDDLFCDIVINKATTRAYPAVIVDTEYGEVSVEIPKDITNSAKFVINGKGAPHQYGSGHGNMFVTMKVVDDDQPLDFDDKEQAYADIDVHRRIDDLLCDIVINKAMIKSYSGVAVETEFGKVPVDIPKNIKDTAKFVIRGKGAPGKFGMQGDLIVTMKVLDNETMEKYLADLRKTGGPLYRTGSAMDDKARRYKIGNKEVCLSEGFTVYSKLVKILNTESRRAVKEFSSSYSDWGDAATVSDRALGKLHTLLEKGFMACKDVALQNGVYDYNPSKIGGWTWAKITDNFSSVLASMHRQLNSINQAQSEAELEREIRKESRTRFFGVGFGLEGFVKASLAAGALNMGTGLIHSAFNLAGNTFTAISANSERSDLYNSSLFGLQAAVNESFEYLLNEVGRIIVRDVRVDKEKEMAIVKNIKDGSFGEGANLKAAFADAFQAFPFDKELYIAYMRMFPEDEKRIMSMADYLGLELEDSFYELFNFNGFTFHSLSSAEYVKSIEMPFLQHIDLMAKKYDKEEGGFRLSRKLFKERFLKEFNSLELVDGLMVRYMTKINVPEQYEEVVEYRNRKYNFFKEVREKIQYTCTETPLQFKVKIGYSSYLIAFYLKLYQIINKVSAYRDFEFEQFYAGTDITPEIEQKIRNKIWTYKDAADIYLCYMHNSHDKYLAVTSEGLVNQKFALGYKKDMDVYAEPGRFGTCNLMVDNEDWDNCYLSKDNTSYLANMICGILPFCTAVLELIDLKREGIEKGRLNYLHNIGVMYNNGDPRVALARDYPRAKFWYQKAADLGDIDSQNWLAKMYQKWADVEPVSEAVAMEDFNFPVSNNAQSMVLDSSNTTVANNTPVESYIEDYTPKFQLLRDSLGQDFWKEWGHLVAVLDYIKSDMAEEALKSYANSWTFQISQLRAIYRTSVLSSKEGFFMTEGYLLCSKKPNVLLALNEIEYLRMDYVRTNGLEIYIEPSNTCIAEASRLEGELKFLEKMNEIVFGFNRDTAVFPNSVTPAMINQAFADIRNTLSEEDISALKSDSLYIMDLIPEKKAKNVANSYAQSLGIKADDIKLLLDSTLFGNAKDGMIITNQFIIDSSLKRPVSFNQIQYLRIVTIKEGDYGDYRVFAEPMHQCVVCFKRTATKKVFDRINEALTQTKALETTTTQQYVCPSCGQLINYGDAFCDSCGTQLTWGDGSGTSTTTQETTSAQQYECPVCKHLINYGDAFCDNCGTQISWG